MRPKVILNESSYIGNFSEIKSYTRIGFNPRQAMNQMTTQTFNDMINACRYIDRYTIFDTVVMDDIPPLRITSHKISVPPDSPHWR